MIGARATVRGRAMILGDRVDAVLQIGHKLGCRRDIDAVVVASSRRGVPVAIDMARRCGHRWI